MKIGFDAKRAFHNNTGLGNYSRDTIRILSKFYPQHHYLLYTPKAKTNQRLEFLKDIKNVNIRTPKSIMHQSFSGIWRSVTLSKQLYKDQIDVFHGLSHELPKGIQKTTTKTVVTIHDLIFIRYLIFLKALTEKYIITSLNTHVKLQITLLQSANKPKPTSWSSSLYQKKKLVSFIKDVIMYFKKNQRIWRS